MSTLSRWINRAKSDDRGDITLEFIAMVVILLLLLGWMFVWGVHRQAVQKVQHAAAEGARAASVSRTIGSATPSAYSAATEALDGQGLHCATQSVAADTSAFLTRPGVPARVSVTVTCTVSFDSFGWPGVFGSRTITETAMSPVDTYKERLR